MLVMYLDESGDHSLDKIDPQYPRFVLGGIVVEHDYALGHLAETIRRFKREVFGDENVILHTADITRNRNGFERLKEPAFRQRFYDELNRLMRSLDFRVVACAIRKDAHLDRYGHAALDPYLLSLNVLIERFYFELSADQTGEVIAEKRGRVLDRELDLARQDLRLRGTPFLDGMEVQRRISGLITVEKGANLPGLQLADLVVSPIGRAVLGKSSHEDFKIVEEKFRRGPDGTVPGYGLVVLPKT